MVSVEPHATPTTLLAGVIIPLKYGSPPEAVWERLPNSYSFRRGATLPVVIPGALRPCGGLPFVPRGLNTLESAIPNTVRHLAEAHVEGIDMTQASTATVFLPVYQRPFHVDDGSAVKTRPVDSSLSAHRYILPC